MQNLDVDYFKEFYSLQDSLLIFNQLKTETNWKQQKIWLFGKEVLEPRLVAWYGDKPYAYSGKLMQPEAWTPLLLSLKKAVENATNFQFNAVLLNYYRNGNDSMGWHSDNEKTLGQNPVIASLNFGQSRKFQFRYTLDKQLKTEFLLENGSLLLMKGTTQHFWQHQLPKSLKMNGERINLTFRKIIS